MKILSDRMLCIKGSAAHSRCKYVDRPSRSADEQLHNNAQHRKCLRKKTTACVSLFVFFTIRRGTFPYSIEGDACTTSQTPTTHYTNTCVKVTIVTHLFFSERIAIANLSFLDWYIKFNSKQRYILFTELQPKFNSSKYTSLPHQYNINLRCTFILTYCEEELSSPSSAERFSKTSKVHRTWIPSPTPKNT